MKRHHFFSLLVLALLLFMSMYFLQAQDLGALLATDTCDDVRYLMDHDTTPALLRGTGGGAISVGASADGQVGANNIGDLWSFGAEDTNRNTTATITFTQIPADTILEFAVFHGMERISTGVHYVRISSGQSYSVPIVEDGLYTIVVQAANLAAVQNSSGQESYQFRLSGDFTNVDVTSLLREEELVDASNSQRKTLGSGFEFVDGVQVLDFHNGGALVSANPGAVTSVSSQSGTQVFFDLQSIIIGRWAQAIDISGGNLSAVDTQGSRIFYLENYGYQGTQTNQAAIELAVLDDSNGTRIVTDWDELRGMWVLADCIGFERRDGRQFTTPVSPDEVARAITTEGQPEAQNNYACPAFYLRVNALDASNATTSHDICIAWDSIEPDSEVRLKQSVFSASLVEDRSVALHSTSIRFLPLDPSVYATQSSYPYPLDIQVSLDGAPSQILLDWLNLSDFAYENGQFTFTFLDQPRTFTSRDATDFATISALDDVIHIRYRGEDPREVLMLPRGDSYVEITTPAGNPAFGGESFDGTRLPDEPGYQPRGLNNLGGECYPVNTALSEANCPENGYPNPANGNLWYAVTDHIAYGNDLDLTLTRSYNSAAHNSDGAFGLGWSIEFPIDYAVAFDAETNTRPIPLDVSYLTALDLTWVPRGLVSFRTPSGSQHSFILEADPAFQGEIYRAVTMPGWVLVREGRNPLQVIRSEWRLEQDNGRTYTFDRAGRLLRYGDGLNTIEIDYSYGDNFNGLAGQDVTISDAPNQRELLLTYDSNHHIVLSVLRDVNAGTEYRTEYLYEGNLLTRVRYPDGLEATYEYDDVGRLLKHNDPRAPIAREMVYTYSVDGGLETASIVTSDGDILWRSFAVEDTGTERRVTVTNQLGGTETWVYALDAGSLTEPGASYTLLSRSGGETAQAEFNGTPIRFEWADGLLRSELARTTNGGGRNTILYSYTPTGRLTGVDRGYPKVEILALFDEQLPLPRYTPGAASFADGTALTYTYDEQGRVQTLIDRNGTEYTFAWDAERPDLLARLERSDGVSWQYIYAEEAPYWIQSITQIRDGGDTEGYTRSFEYDAFGRVVNISDSLGLEYAVTYDDIPLNDSYHSRILITEPTGARTELRFDQQQRLTEKITHVDDDPQHYLERTSYEYADPLGRITSESHWLRNEDGTEDDKEEALTTTYDYEVYPPVASAVSQMAGAAPVDDADFIGERITVTDPYGRRKAYIYDALGRIRIIEESFEQHTEFEYSVRDVVNPQPVPDTNSNGLRIVQRDYFRDALTAQTTYIFSETWQLTGVQRETFNGDAEVPTSNFAWRIFRSENQGSINPRSVDMPTLGIRSATWSGYEGGQATGIAVDLLNPLTGGYETDPTMDLQYDNQGRVQRITQDGLFWTFAYCPLGSGETRIMRSHPNEEVTCDSATFSVALTYDAHERLVVAEDEFGRRNFEYGVSSETHETVVQVEAVSTEDSEVQQRFTWELRYDALGRLTHWLNDGGFTHQYEYDTLGRLVAVDVADVAAGVSYPEASYSYRYNSANLLEQEVDGLGRGFLYDYNPQGQVIAQQNLLTRDTTTFAYDAQGRMVSSTSPLGVVTSFAYDDPADPNRVTQVITPDGRETYEWQLAERRLVYRDGLGRETSYLFDAFGLLWRVDSPEGRTYLLERDTRGNLVRWSVGSRNDQTGAETADRSFSIAYGTDYSITASNEATGWDWQFQTTPNGQLERMVNFGNHSIALAYDPFGRLRTLETGGLNWTVERSDQSAEILVQIGTDTEITLTYDALYRQIEREINGSASTFTYVPTVPTSENDAPNSGNVDVQVVTAEGPRVYTFSAGSEFEGRQILVREPGQFVRYTYNAEDLLVSIDTEICLPVVETGETDAGAEKTNTDAAALMVNEQDYTQVFAKLEDEEGAVCAENSTTETWRANICFQYDTQGRLIRIIDELQGVETFTYDEADNLIVYQDRGGKTYSYTYDNLNRLTSITGPTGVQIWLAYEVNQVREVCRTAAGYGATSYETCRNLGEAQHQIIETYDYDEVGRLISQSFPNQNATASITYNHNQRLTGWGDVSISYEASDRGDMSSFGGYDLEYDAFGNLASVTGDDSLQITYDDLGRVVSMTVAGETLEYTYEGNGFTVRYAGDEIAFAASEGGILQMINTSEVPLITIYNVGQDDEGNHSLTLKVNDQDFISFFMDAQYSVLSVGYSIGDQLISTSNRRSFEGQLQQQSIATIDSPLLNELFGVEDEGTILIVYGYNEANLPLTMRITDASRESAGGLLYQVSYIYDDFGQLQQESRQFENNTRVEIRYRYASNQLIERTVTLFTPDAPPQTFDYTYEYDDSGNLSVVRSGEEICEQYSYDTLNRLTSLERGSERFRYEYDVYNRLVNIGNARLIYQGVSDMPFASVENGITTLYGTLANGLSLLQIRGDAVQLPILGDNGQTLSGASADLSEQQQAIIFDPYGDPITSLLSDFTDEFGSGCDWSSQGISEPGAAFQPPQQVFQGMMWDSQANVFFQAGRVYSPEHRHFLQRSWLGPVADGSVYTLGNQATIFPVRPFEETLDMGLRRLDGVISQLALASGLNADAVWASHIPQPVGYTQNHLVATARDGERSLQRDLFTLVDLPVWLKDNYNLSSPYLDGDALRIMPDQAAGQGGLGITHENFFDHDIWQAPIWLPTSPVLPGLSWMLADNRPPQTITTFQPDAWRPARLTLDTALGWSDAKVPEFDATPADVMAHLPQIFSTYPIDSLAVLDFTSSLTQAPLVEPRTWIDDALAQALPTCLEAPLAPTVDLWRQQWFTEDTFGIASILSRRYPALPPLDASPYNLDGSAIGTTGVPCP